MAQTIKLRRSATAGATPTTAQLELGEVAINTYDGKMYIKKSVGGTESIVELGSGLTPADAIFEEYLYTATNNQTAFTGNDDNSTFLSYVSGAIQVFLNGVLLDPETDYTATNGATVTLTSGAATNDYLQIIAFKKKIGDGSVTVDTFSGNNSTTAFTLSLNPGDENNTRVFIDGVYQSKSNYSVSGTTLTFSSAPPSGTGIEVEIGNRAVSLDTTTSLDLPDNVKLRLGTSQDLEIYHNGSHSYIDDAGTGNLYIRNGTKNSIFARTDGEVILYHNDANKLATTSTGVDVTGNIVVSGTVDGVDLQVLNTTAGAALPKAGGAMTGAITTNSTFDGRNVSVDGAKLDGIESGATGDQTLSEINALGITATGLSGTPAISVANITTTGELRGPASLVIDPAAVGDNTGTVVIKGNLQVDGATTTINSTTLTVDDLNLTLASGAANGTAANGAGITVDGASANITYQSNTDTWDFNKNVKFNTVQAHGSNNFLIDSPAEIQLDSHNGHIRLRTQGGDIGTLQLSNNDLTIRSMVSDRDIIFQGYDGSTNITALSLDMSNSGTAVFGGQIITPASGVIQTASSAGTLTISGGATNKGGQIVLSGGNNTGTGGSGIKFYAQASTASPTERMRIDSVGNVGIGNTSPTFYSGYKILHLGSAASGGQGLLKFGTGGTADGPELYAPSSGNRLHINTSGSVNVLNLVNSNVGIGETSPSVSRLHVKDNKGSAGDVWTQVGPGNNMGITLQNETTADNANSVIYFKNDTDYVASIGARYVSHSTNETEIRFGTTNSSGTTTEKMYLRGGGELQTLAPVMVGGSVGLAASQISGTPADLNYTEVGKGYINLARDDTAAAAQLRFAKNGSVHSYLETRSTGLGFVTDVGNFAFEGGNVGIGTTNPTETLELTRLGKIGFGMNGNYGARIGYFDDGSGIHGFHVDTKHLGTTTSETRFVVRADSGNVGIGTKTPNALLDLEGVTASSSPILRFTGTGNASQGDVLGQIEFYNSDTTDNTAGIMGKIRAIAGASGGEGSMQFLVDMPSEGADANKVALHLNANGNVGIGSTSPYFPLHVQGPTGFNGEAKNNILAFDTTSAATGTGGGIAFGGYSNGTGGDIYHFGNIQGIKENSTAGNYASAMLFSTRANGATPLERMRIDSTGNVGIGTNNPGDIKLKVHSNDSDDYIAIFKQTHASNLGTVQIDTPTDNNARPSRLDFARGGVNKWKTGMVYGDTSNGWGLSDATGSGTALQQTRFLVQPGGNVGIGTTSPSSWASYTDSNATVLQVEDSSQRARIVINGGAGAHLDLVDYAGGTNDKHMNIAVDGGILKFGSLNDAGNAWVKDNIMIMDLGSGNVAINHGLGGGAINSKFNVFADGEAIRVDGTANTSRTIRFRSCGVNGSSNAIIESDGSLQLKNADANAAMYFNSVRDMEFQVTSGNGTAGNMTFSSYNTEIMRVDGASNRVGIGTGSTVGAKLQVKGAGGATGLTFKTTDASNNETSFIMDGGRAGIRYYPFTVGTASSTTYSGVAFEVNAGSPSFPQLHVKQNGKVGIGWDAPTAALSILDSDNTTTNQGLGGLRVHRPNDANQYGYFDYNYGGGGLLIGSNYTGYGSSSTRTGEIYFYQHNTAKQAAPIRLAAFFNSYGHFEPGADASYDLGSNNKRWRNVYTTDLHLSNESKEGGNDVDGTTGNWTVQEGAENLYLINNKTGKKYKFALEEIE